MCCVQSKKTGTEVLTVGVVLLPDSIHSPVSLYSQEEAPVFTVQPFGILEAPRREATAAAVLRCSGKSRDFSCGHLFSRFPATASSPSDAVLKPHCGFLTPPNSCLLLPPLLHRPSHKLIVLNPWGQAAWTPPLRVASALSSPSDLKAFGLTANVLIYF